MMMLFGSSPSSLLASVSANGVMMMTRTMMTIVATMIATTIVITNKKQQPSSLLMYHHHHHHYNLLRRIINFIITLFFLFVDHYHVTVVYGEFNNQVMERANDRLMEYMSIPVQLSNRMYQYDFVGGFPNHMNPIDRIVTSHFMYIEYPNTLYYGLEDGTFLYYDPSFNAINYREPGNSGYYMNWNNASNDDNRLLTNTSIRYDNYKKFFNSCLADNGTFIECIMDDGQQYIDNCNIDNYECNLQLIPCSNNNDNSKVIEELTQNSSTSTSSNINDSDNNIIWCTNYTIKTYNITTDNQRRGYIPRIKSCINPSGLHEQNNGKVLLNKTTMELGNCYSKDQTTIIQNNVTGPYEFCQISSLLKNNNSFTTIYGDDNTTTTSSTKSTDDRIQCSTTFSGGYESIQYDPRFRGWYVTTKQQQKPVWSDPYPFFQGNDIGITYSIPLYQYNNNQQKVFYGVIAVDYFLGKLRDFFTNEYSNTDMMLLIVEKKIPNYIIATSTGTLATKLVMKSNTSQLCNSTSSYTNNNDNNITSSSNECIIDRVSIMELTNQYNNPMDIILKRAYIEHEMNNFPTTELVSVKETNEIGSTAYVAQGNLFIQENLKWHVIVVMPMERSTNDAVLKGSTMSIVVCVLGTIGVISCFTLFYIFYNKRNERAVIQADWRFTCGFIFNCSILNLSTFTLIGPNTNQLCMLRMWSFNLLFTCALAPLFVKVWRINRLLSASKGFKRVNVGHFKAFLYGLPIVIFEVIILMIFSFIDPPRAVEDLTSGQNTGYGVQQVTCGQQNNGFLITQVIFHGILILIGCVLAYKTRDLDPKFGEAKQLGFSMYNIAFTGIVILLIFQLVDLDEVSKIVLQAIGVVWGSFFCSLAFVLPRLLEVAKTKTKKYNRSSLTFLPSTGGANEVLVTKSNQSDSSSVGFGSSHAHRLHDLDMHSTQSDNDHVAYGVSNAMHVANVGIRSPPSSFVEKERSPLIPPSQQFLLNRQNEDDSISSHGSIAFVLKSEDGDNVEQLRPAAPITPGVSNRSLKALASKAIGSVRSMMFSSSNLDIVESRNDVDSQQNLLLNENENNNQSRKIAEEIGDIMSNLGMQVSSSDISPRIDEESNYDSDIEEPLHEESKIEESKVSSSDVSPRIDEESNYGSDAEEPLHEESKIEESKLEESEGDDYQ